MKPWEPFYQNHKGKEAPQRKPMTCQHFLLESLLRQPKWCMICKSPSQNQLRFPF